MVMNRDETHAQYLEEQARQEECEWQESEAAAAQAQAEAEIAKAESAIMQCPNCGGRNTACEEWDEGEPIFKCDDCGCRFME